MLISDTLNYRPDGTVSSVTRIERETFIKPSGKEATEDLTETVDLSAVAEVLDKSYGEREATIAALENQIQAMRDEAVALAAEVATQVAALTKQRDAALAAVLDLKKTIAVTLTAMEPLGAALTE